MSSMTRMIARLLLAPALMLAAALLVKGYGDAGDGFSAGVVAGLAVLLQYLALGRREVERLLPVHHAPLVAFAGLLLAFLVAFLPALLGQAPLTHAPAPGEHVVELGSLELHSAVLYDVGVFLLVFGFVVQLVSLLAHAGVRRL